MWTTRFQSVTSAHTVTLQVFGKRQARHTQPVLMYFHGGLFNAGKLESAHDIATALAPQMLVVSVDYPLAPAVQFPQSIELAFEVLAWVCAQAKTLGADTQKLFVAGEQAGGNLAAVLAMLFRDRGLACRHALQGQILLNPMLDALQSSSSMATVGNSPCRQAWADYTHVASNALHPYVSPVHSCRLGGLVRAMVVSSHNHPLRDETEAYASKLLLAGVPVHMQRLEDSPLHLSDRNHPSFQTLCQLIRQFVSLGV